MVALRFSQILLLVMDVGRMCRKRLLEEDLSSPDSCNRQNLCKRDVRQAGQERKRLVWVICAPLLMEHKEDLPRRLSGVREALGKGARERQQSPDLVWGWAINPISFSAPQSPQFTKKYLQTHVVLTAPVWREAAEVLLSTDTHHGWSHLCRNGWQKPPFE